MSPVFNSPASFKDGNAGLVTEVAERPPVPGHGRTSIVRKLKHRLAGPGGIYTLGNLVGLVVGLVVAIGQQPDPGDAPGFAGPIGSYLAGSPAASLMTLATLIFFVSGEAYHRARSSMVGSTGALFVGDFFSGCGALALGAGLFMLGDPLLASTSGMLHAGGKFGSAVTHWTQRRASSACDLACRSLVLSSRLPAMVLAAVALLQAREASWVESSVPITIIICTALWATADFMLLKHVFRPP